MLEVLFICSTTHYASRSTEMFFPPTNTLNNFQKFYLDSHEHTRWMDLTLLLLCNCHKVSLNSSDFPVHASGYKLRSNSGGNVIFSTSRVRSLYQINSVISLSTKEITVRRESSAMLTVRRHNRLILRLLLVMQSDCPTISALQSFTHIYLTSKAITSFF